LARLSFCLIGVATPSELIAEPRITPFNIGKRIDLKDFTPEEAVPLARGLIQPTPGPSQDGNQPTPSPSQDGSTASSKNEEDLGQHKKGRHRTEKQAVALLKRILYWTNGHPYLTQTLCQPVAEDKSVTNAAGVDKLCEAIFFSSRSRDTETNLQHVRTYLLGSDKDQAALLDLYRQVHGGNFFNRIRDDDTNVLINTLRLSGLVRVWENQLWVRNRIYSRVFNKAWIEANMPDAETRRQKAAFRRGVLRASMAAAIVIVSIGGSVYWYFDSYVLEHVAYYNTYVKRFGIMAGVGELTLKQVQERSVSYKFIHQGRYNPVYKVQAVRGTGQLATRQQSTEQSALNQNRDKLTSHQSTAQSALNQNPDDSTLAQTVDELTTRHEVGTYFQSAKSRFELFYIYTKLSFTGMSVGICS
jgi:hypothetical protein